MSGYERQQPSQPLLYSLSQKYYIRIVCNTWDITKFIPLEEFEYCLER
jgi:hypothetical protein